MKEATQTVTVATRVIHVLHGFGHKTDLSSTPTTNSYQLRDVGSATSTYVTLGKPLDLSLLPLPQLQNGNNNTTYIMGLLRGQN